MELSWKNSKEMGVLEKHNTKVSLCELKKNSKNHVFLNQNGKGRFHAPGTPKMQSQKHNLTILQL